MTVSRSRKAGQYRQDESQEIGGVNPTGYADNDMGGANEDPYSGIFGAFPYAIRASNSWVFRLYAVGATLVSVGIAVTVGMGLVVVMGETQNAGGGLFAFSRSMFVLVAFGAVTPLIAPILLVARRHRRDDSVSERYDAALAAAGVVFLIMLYGGLVISTPIELQADVTGVTAPVVHRLYRLPRIAGFGPPTLGAALVGAVHWTLRD